MNEEKHLPPLKKLTRDANKLDAQRVRSETYSEMIVKEQEGLIEIAENGIKKINSDLKALQTRLKGYTGLKPRPRDDIYADLKHRYEFKLGERAALQNAINMAEESITAAKLHQIPGEGRRV